MKFKTTTPKGTEGINISYSDEQKCAETLKDIYPDWTIEFNWFQILFSDVQYVIEWEKKTVLIGYNQNLCFWWKNLLPELKQKLGKEKATPVTA